MKKKNKKTKESKTNFLFWILKNIFFAGLAMYTISVVFQSESNKVLLSALRIDMDIISENPLKNTTLDQRYTIALKEIYSFMTTIKENSPVDAVILYPEYDTFFPANKSTVFKNVGVTNKMWAIRFLYPRKIVKESELETSLYKEKISHIAIVNGWGYEYLSYEFDKEHSLFGVLPVNISNEEFESIKNIRRRNIQSTDNK
jgi:hypothetical protein